MLVLKILGAIAALAIGIWLGLPGRYTQSYEDIEQTIDLGIGRTRKVKRHFTPMAWIQRKASVRGRSRKVRRGFHMESPDDR